MRGEGEGEGDMTAIPRAMLAQVPVNCKSCPACLHPLKAVVEGRSKLPRGISGIREHIRSVDNVPLLLSLFTDCKTHRCGGGARVGSVRGCCWQRLKGWLTV